MGIQHLTIPKRTAILLNSISTIIEYTEFMYTMSYYIFHFQISQCLKYVEILFDPFPMGHRFVIRGSENRKPYALIDFDAHAEPLPSSSESSSTSDLQLYDEENIDDNVE